MNVYAEWVECYRSNNSFMARVLNQDKKAEGNRRRVYRWRRKNKERWNEYQRNLMRSRVLKGVSDEERS